MGNSLLRPEEQNNFAHKISGKNWGKNQKSSFFFQNIKKKKSSGGDAFRTPSKSLVAGSVDGPARAVSLLTIDMETRLGTNWNQGAGRADLFMLNHSTKTSRH